MVTVVESGAPDLQVAQGSEVTDVDGTRQATVLIPAGTAAEMVLPDGTTQPLPTMTLRVSEFTVGDEGPAAMPASLPPNVAYTWAAEVSADEAIGAGATQVQFDQPVVLHLDNFLDMPVGAAVPLGYYDREIASWVGADNGLVIEILSIDGQGRAELDVDGSGLPADAATLDELGITDDERVQLAVLYTPGTSLWRMEIPHLTPWDANWPVGPSEDAVPPPADDIEDDDDDDDPDPEEPTDPEDPETPPDPEREEDNETEPDCDDGSVIECQNQVLGESVGIPGTGMSLHYASDRVPGRGGSRHVRLRLSEATIPSTLAEIELEIRIGGHRFVEFFSAAPDLVYDLDWDGEDAYGRTLQGPQPVTVIKRYHYRYESYGSAADFTRSWERFSEGDFGIEVPRVRFPARYTWSRESRILPGQGSRRAGSWDARGIGLGGWSLSAHHVYDPKGRTLYLGTSERRRVQRFDATLSLVAGGPTRGYSGDGGPAILAELDTPTGLVSAPDGSLYFAELDNHVVRRVDPSGIITTFAGSGVPCNDSQTEPSLECGDGGLATLARLHGPAGVDIETDGTVLIADYLNQCVRRVTPDGVIDTAAGRCVAFVSEEVTGTNLGESAPPCEDCTADAVDLSLVSDVQALPGGGFLLVTSSQIFRVTPEGLIQSFAGDPDATEPGDGGPASEAGFNDALRIAQGPDGSLYIAEGAGHRVRRIGSDGTITTVAGTGNAGSSGDGGPALEARLNRPNDVAVAPDGTLYISDGFNNRIRRVTPSGRIDTVVGGGIISPFVAANPSTLVALGNAGGVALSPDAESLFVSNHIAAVHRHGPPFPGFDANELRIPSVNGNEVYFLDPDGRHLRTVDSLTGEELLTFGYDTEGRLTTITDGDGLTITIERDTEGVPQAIAGPYGHMTELTLDANGWLSEVVTPLGRSHEFTHTATGLLVEHRDPEENESIYEYDASGRLKRATNRAGRTKELTRFGFGEDYRVQLENPLGDSAIYHVDNQATGAQIRTRTIRSPVHQQGFTTTTELRPNGRRIVTYRDGTVVTTRRGGDPRGFGMAAPLALGGSIALPSGLTWSFTRTRDVVLTDPLDPLSLESLTDTMTVNDRTYTRDYDPVSRTFTLTTPEGRVTSMRVDGQRRPIEVSAPGRAPVSITYDADGRPEEFRQGTGADERVLQFDYDGQGRVGALIDPLLRETVFTYDDDDRVTVQELPGGRVIGLTYDGNSNVETLTPPGRPAHSFSYAADELRELYDPPDAPGVPNDGTAFIYDENRRLDTVVRPAGDEIRRTYDPYGRLRTISYQGAGLRTLGFDYSPLTGRVEALVGPGGNQTSYQYDGALLTSIFQLGVGGVNRTVTSDFWLETEAVNGLNAVSFEYDDDGLLESAGLLDIERDPLSGFVTGTTHGLVTTSDHFDPVFAELDETAATFNGSEIFRLEYPVRDKLGRIVVKRETIGGVTDEYSYTYDPAGRLESVTKNGSPFASYTYDANGNRLTYDGTFGTVTSTEYDDQDRLLTYGATTFTYTPGGELRTRTENGVTATYTYDAFGNLIRVILPDGIEIDYLLDGLGRRIGKRVNGTLTQQFLYRDYLNPIAELDASDDVVSHFVYGTRGNVPDYMVRDGVTYRILSDHLGSVRLLVDVATGSIAQRLDYDEYGRIIQDSNPGFQPFGFAGGLYDHQTGLVRFGARDYDPRIGRWTAKDPIRFGGDDTNLYSYAAGDPLNHLDPTGLYVLNCSDAPISVKPEDNELPIGELPPGYEWSEKLDGVFLQPNGPWWKLPGKTWLPDNEVIVQKDGSVECIGGLCSLPFLGPERLEEPPDPTWVPPATPARLPGCKPAPEEKCRD